MGRIAVAISVAVILGIVSGSEHGIRMPPFWFLVHGRVRDRAQASDELPVSQYHGARKCSARRFVHELHEFVRETGHGAGDADAADVWATANAVHPTAFCDVAI